MEVVEKKIIPAKTAEAGSAAPRSFQADSKDEKKAAVSVEKIRGHTAHVEIEAVPDRGLWGDKKGQSNEGNQVHDGSDSRGSLKMHSLGPSGLTEDCSLSLTMAAGGTRQQHDIWSPAKPKPALGEVLSDEERIALEKYAAFKTEFDSVPHGGCTIEHVRASSAGVDGWSKANFNPDEVLKLNDPSMPYASAGLCGLWAKQALMAASMLPQWERVVLTVDSGASDTVLPPSIARNVPLIHSDKVGIEYEVANGGVVVNLGEKKAEMKLREDDTTSMIMSFQVVEVHKPLLAVSRLVENGHRVCFDKQDPHILLSTGAKIPMKCNMGTYEVEVWILNPGFTGPR